MKTTSLVAFVAVVVAARAGGLFTLGVVTSESMGETLPVGSLFLALRSSPDEGDVVVYRAPDGALVVHRVVGVTEEGLVTRGDANAATDQANGIPPVDPREVNVLPHVFGTPLALRHAWLKPLALGALQVALLTLGLRRVVTDAARRGSGPWRRLRPHHLVVAAAGVLLVAAPLLHDRAEASGTVAVSGHLLPTVARVESDAGVVYAEVAPMGTARVPAEGPTDIVAAPALPGARLLAGFGATFAMLPAALALGGVAFAFREGGW